MRTFSTLCFFATACAALGQTSAHPEFEVETVKLNKSGAADHTSRITGTQFVVRNTTISELLPLAFQRKEELIVGAPTWFRSDRYDIVAKGSRSVSEATLGLMVQSLLAQEFKLTFHEEQRPVDAFALLVAPNGPRFREVPGDPSRRDCNRSGATEQLVIECPAIGIADLIARLSFVARDYIDRPVVDLTGLTRNYELKLEWVPRRIADDTGGLTVFGALTKQLGLKLEQRKLPVPVIVIDHADQPPET